MKTSKDRIFDEIIDYAVSKAEEEMEEYDWMHEDEKPDPWDDEYDDYIFERESEKEDKIRYAIEDYMNYDLDLYDLYEIMGYDEDDEEYRELMNKDTYYTIDFKNAVREVYDYYERQQENEKLRIRDKEKYEELNAIKYSDDGSTLLYVGENCEGKLLINCKTISDSALDKAEKITEIEISEGVEVIPAYLFCNCKSLEKVKLPNSIMDIGQGAFEGCENLEEVDLPLNLKEISVDCFNECYKLRKVRIPNSVEYIGNQAFCGCEKIKDISFGINLKVIGNRAFAYCSINWVRLPNTLESLGGDSFMHTDIDTLEIPPRTKITGEFSLSNCKRLRHFIIPTGITEINKDCFENCNSLEFIYIPYSVSKIEVGCFNDCEQLKLVQIDKDNEAVFESNGIYYNLINDQKIIFYYSNSLEEIIISDRESIAPCEFESKKSLRKVIIKDGVKSIGRSAFAYCENLEEVILPKSLTSIGSECFKCTKLRKIALPSMGGVSQKAFELCNLDEIVINGDVKYLADNYFKDVHVKSVVLPPTITGFSYNAFNNIWIRDVHFRNTNPRDLNIERRSGTNSLAIKNIYVPSHLLSNYKLSFDFSYYAKFFGE